LAKPGKRFPWVGAWLATGLALRLYHYGRNPAMWHDEAALVLNVLDKSFTQLLGPLSFSEAAPPLFLWLERAVVLALGDGTYALRLVPCAASCAALVLVVALARRALPRKAVPWAALLAGCSDRLLWHSCEAKPYAVDALVAAGLTALVVWGQGRTLRQQLFLATLLTPLLLFLSYPACFLLGGVALCLLPAVVRAVRANEAGRLGNVLTYAVFVTVLGGSFLLLLQGPIRAQQDAALRQNWNDMFPPWEHPRAVPGWLLIRLSEVVRYAEEPVGNLLAGIAVVGAVLLWREGRRRFVVFLLGPLALAGLAALLGQYPLGATRVMAFAAPALLLLIAHGLPPTLSWLRRFGRLGPAVVAAVVFFPVSQAAYRVVCPWERAASDRAADYVATHRESGEQVLGTKWEHDYYFRGLAADYQPLDRCKEGGAAHIWLMAAGKTEAARNAWLEELPGTGAWHIIDRQEFPQTTVFRLEFIPRGGAGRGCEHE
jgi:uncharacterized membrane protein